MTLARIMLCAALLSASSCAFTPQSERPRLLEVRGPYLIIDAAGDVHITVETTAGDIDEKDTVQQAPQKTHQVDQKADVRADIKAPLP